MENATKSKLELFTPLAEKLNRNQIKNIVESHLKAIERRNKPKPSIWSFIFGKRHLNPGGFWALKEFE